MAFITCINWKMLARGIRGAELNESMMRPGFSGNAESAQKTSTELLERVAESNLILLFTLSNMATSFIWKNGS
jgi:hypothetical protein